MALRVSCGRSFINLLNTAIYSLGPYSVKYSIQFEAINICPVSNSLRSVTKSFAWSSTDIICAFHRSGSIIILLLLTYIHRYTSLTQTISELPLDGIFSGGGVREEHSGVV